MKGYNGNELRTGHYAGVTFIVSKDVGTQFQNEYFRRKFEQVPPSTIDYLHFPEEENYLGTRKHMIVLEKSSHKEKTILFDNSDRFYATITFLYRLTYLSDPEHVALEVIRRTLMENGFLKSLLKNAKHIYVGRFLFQGSRGEQSELESQSQYQHIEVQHEKSPKRGITVGREVLDEIPKHKVWKNVKNIHKIIADQQNKNALNYFYEERLSTLKKEVRKLKSEYTSLDVPKFYRQLHHFELQLLELKHKKKHC